MRPLQSRQASAGKAPAPNAYTYQVRPQALRLVVAFAILGFLALPSVVFGATSETRIEGTAVLLIFVLLGVRASRTGSLLQSDDRLIVRTLARTYRLMRSEVEAFAVESGDVRPYSRKPRAFIVVRLANGHRASFKAINGDDLELARLGEQLNARWSLRLAP